MAKATKPRIEQIAIYIHPLARAQWSPEHVPAELKLISQWRQCYRYGSTVNNKQITTTKQPIGGPTISKIPFSKFSQLITSDPELHWGFCLTQDDEILGIDIDDLPQNFTLDDIPVSIKKVLQSFPTYVELSPSGQGLHAFYRTNKAFLKHRSAADNATDGFKGALYIRDQFMTFTGHTYTPLSQPGAKLHELDANLLEKLLLKPNNTTILPTASTAPSSSTDRQVPTIEQLAKWLSFIPPTLSTHPSRERYYEIYRTFNPPVESPSDYEHWRIIAAALHYGAALAGAPHIGAEYFDDWSSKDSINYESSAAAIAKYHANPPRFDGTDITHLTLAKLAQATVPRWPYPEVDKKGNLTNRPIPNNVKNFEVMLEHFNVYLTQNEISKEIHATGNDIVVSKYFPAAMTRPDLETYVMNLCHDTYFQRIGSQTASAFAKHMYKLTTTTFNPIKQWIDNTPSPPPGQFDRLFNTLTIPAHERELTNLYKSYLKKALMGIIRAHYYTGSWGSTTGMLILMGNEQTYKSTWVKQLLPKEFRQYIIPSQQTVGKGYNVKDIQLEAGVAQILLKDECESWFNGNDALIKNLLVQEYDAHRPLYGTTPIMAPRKCIFIGTTNRRELPITDDGSRRIQIIPIESCDTYAQLEIDMAMVYRELLDEFVKVPVNKQYTLWSLTEDEISRTNLINFDQRKADQEADIYLKECFDFDSEFNLSKYVTSVKGIHRPSLYTSTRVREIIRDITGAQVSPNALKHALQRQAGQWTKTYAQPHNTGKAIIDKGWCYEKKSKGLGNVYSGWLLPARLTNIPVQETE